jgi:gliding motility-associated-like protein
MAPRYQVIYILILFTTSFDLLTQTPRRDWATYHGGSADDSFRDMAIDLAGSIYVIGSSSSTNSISTVGSYQLINAGGSDVFISKYDTDGNKQWSTYFGGTGDDFGQSIDISANGDIFITGLTFSTNGIATSGTHQNINNGGGDAFIAKFNNNGNRIWGSYFGGFSFDFSNDIEVDNAGNPIVIGWTQSSSNIASFGSYQNTYSVQDDVLLAKFNTNGQLQWSTYYGDVGFDTGLQVESDASNNIVISGWSSSLVNIASVGAFQTTYGGNTADCFLAKFDQSGSRLWATYYGGSGDDYSDALVVNDNGDIYMSGSTNSSNNIFSSGAFQASRSAGFDAFLTRFSSAGVRSWATYFGGNGDDTAYRLRQGLDNAIYMFGHTLSTDRMASPGAFQINKSGGRDAFLSRFENSGSLTWSTYYGGNNNDFGYGLVLDANDDIFINGTTEGSTNLATSGSSQPTYGGAPKDGYIAKFEPCTTPILDFRNSGFSCSLVNYVFEFELTGQPPFTIFYSIDGIAQTPWMTNNSSFFPVVNANLWTKIIQIDSVKSGACKGNINSLWGFIQVRDSISASQPVITCDPLTATYTITVDLSGGAFGGFSSVGPNDGFISATGRFVSFPIANSNPFVVQFTEVGTFSNCDTISYSGSSGCSIPCPTLNVLISSNSPICAGSTLNLMASGGSTYQWSGPNGYTSAQQNPVINTTSSMQGGVYSVTVTAANNCTAIATTSTVITSPPIINISTNSPLCAGSTLNLMASGGSTYQWSGPNGYTSFQQNPSITATTSMQAGTYIVTITTIGGCTSTSNTIVVINPTPIAILSSNSPVCNIGDIAFQLSGGVSYSWSGPNNFTSLIQNPIIYHATIASSGSYSVTVTGQNGCITVASTIVNVTGQLNVQASSNSPLCLGDTIRFTANGGTTYTWNGPNGFNANTQNSIIASSSFNMAGIYFLTTTDASGCIGTKEIIVVVQERPIANIQGDTQICQGSLITLTSSSNATNLLWSNGATTPSITVLPSTNDSYNLIVDLNGCKDTSFFTVKITSAPVLKLNLSSATIIEGESIQLTVTGANEYNWTPDYDLSCDDCSNPLASPQETTSYCVLGITNGCTADTCVNITVKEACILTVPNIFTPNGDGANDNWCSLAKECIVNQTLTIYNRWGNLLYKVSGLEVCWDGKFRGKELGDQVVTYSLFLLDVEGNKISKGGSITLLK